jgi:hypothetical protein
MASSELYDGEILIHDTTVIGESPAFGRGLDLGLRGPGDYEYGAAADPFPPELLIPRSEWQSRIQEMEQTKTRLSDLIRLRNSPCKNQQSTNFCWFNSPTRCTEIVYLQQSGRTATLSPASGACHVTNFRNVGGWGRDALEWITEHGLNDVKDWPANAIDRRYDTPENRTKAMANRIVEWTELKPRNVDQLISMLLRRIPVACGFNWWGHEVTAVDPVWVDGAAVIRIENSWGMQWGANGMAILQGSKMLPDDACAPRTANVTE